MKYSPPLVLLACAALLSIACGDGGSEADPTRTPSERPRVRRTATPMPTPAVTATETPTPATSLEEEVVEATYHHVEGPRPVVVANPRPGPANPAPPPPPDRPIAELLHPPPYTVFIDAGHGGLDSGSANQGLLEKNVNLDVAARLAGLLTSAGYNVVLSRSCDCTLTAFPVYTYENRRDEIQARVDVANVARADILVSIHFNGGPASARGLEIYYNPDRSFGHYNWTLADLARQALLSHIRSAGYDVPDRGVKNDAGVCCNPANPHSWILGTNAGFRPSLMPGIIGEAMFLSNYVEAQQLWRPEMRQAIANGYRAGIEAYFAWIQAQMPATPTPTPTPTATPTVTPSLTPTPSLTVPVATATATPTLLPTPTSTTSQVATSTPPPGT